MTFFSALWKPKPETETAAKVYLAIVAQARHPRLYLELGAPDTVDGRFDLIVLHAMLVMRRLRREGEAGKAHAQALFDYMFADMDRSLREMGVGDMSIGRHIKNMAKAFYSRAATCEQGLEGDEAALASALIGILYRTKAPDPARATAMGQYLRAIDVDLSAAGLSDILAGKLPWRSP